MRLRSEKHKYSCVRQTYMPMLFLHTTIKKFLSFRSENSVDILYIFRKHVVLVFCKIVYNNNNNFISRG